MNTRICIVSDGTDKTGRLIIAYLQNLGGRNIGRYAGFLDGDYVYININGVIVWERFRPKHYTLIDLPPVIGYKCPMDLWGGFVEKGSIWEVSTDTQINAREYSTYSTLCARWLGLPPEIVEQWEPVFPSVNTEKKGNIDPLEMGQEEVFLSLAAKYNFPQCLGALSDSQIADKLSALVKEAMRKYADMQVKLAVDNEKIETALYKQAFEIAFSIWDHMATSGQIEKDAKFNELYDQLLKIRKI